MIKRILLLLLFLSPITNTWADEGKELYEKNCISCHGVNGAKPILPIYPKLNGQNAAYTVKQLKDFQSGTRMDPVMKAMAMLIIGKEQAVADYLAKQQ